VDGKTVLVMTVEKGDNPPYALKKVVQAHTTATCRLDQAVENIAWMIAHDEADYGSSEEEHQQEIQALHGRKALKPLVVSVVLVDCLIYRGFAVVRGDTPHHHQTVTNPLQPG
jgi:hypothetical protein